MNRNCCVTRTRRIRLSFHLYQGLHCVTVLFIAGLSAGFGTLGAQDIETLKFSVNAYDKLFSTLTPDQTTVTVGDMVFNVESLRRWRDHLKAKVEGKSAGPRGAFDFTTFGTAWPNSTVYYDYATSGTNAMPANSITRFERAIRLWQECAAINFVRRTTEADYILVSYNGDGTMDSYIGKTGGSQLLRVAGWGNDINCAHEIGHALGLTHEQCRPDRDAFVTIHSTNMTVNPTTDANYAIVPSTISRTTYDYDSAMHYSRTADAKSPGLITISAKAPNEHWSDGLGPEEIGQKTHLSVGDKSAMAAQYGSPLAISGTVKDVGGSPMRGVIVHISGGATYRGWNNPTATDGAGNYSFTGLPRNSGTYTITPTQLGTSFVVASQNVAIGTADQTAVDFTRADATPPGLVILQPASGQLLTNAGVASGGADDSGGG